MRLPNNETTTKDDMSRRTYQITVTEIPWFIRLFYLLMSLGGGFTTGAVVIGLTWEKIVPALDRLGFLRAGSGVHELLITCSITGIFFAYHLYSVAMLVVRKRLSHIW